MEANNNIAISETLYGVGCFFCEITCETQRTERTNVAFRSIHHTDDHFLRQSFIRYGLILGVQKLKK